MCEFDDVSVDTADVADISDDVDVAGEIVDISDEVIDCEAEIEPLSEIEIETVINEFEEPETLPESVDVTSELKSVVDQNVQPLAIPNSHGEWSGGERGSSEWVMEDEFVPNLNNPEGLSIGEIKERYGFDAIQYNGKDPDFSPFLDEKIGEVELDEFSDERTGKGGTYDLAIQKAVEKTGLSANEIKEYVKENNLTWHECADRKTVQLIPTIINSTFKHSGGISMEKSINALGDYLEDNYGELSLSREPIGAGQKIDFDVDAFHKELRSELKKYKE